jgi:hypothetical protein
MCALLGDVTESAGQERALSIAITSPHKDCSEHR